MKPLLKKLSAHLLIARRWFEPSGDVSPNYWGYPVAILRTTLAATLLLTLLSTPLDSLFQPLFGEGDRPDCAAQRLVPNIYCLTESTLVGKYVSCAILVFVISGFLPQICGVLHYWVAYSFMDGSSVSDGGDQIATILTLLLIPITLTDRRINSWKKPIPRKSTVSISISAAFIVGIKIQMSALYLQSSIEKISQPEWQIGNNIYYTSIGQFGFTDWIKAALEPLLYNPLGSSLITWSVIIVEFLIGVALIAKIKYRFVLFIFAVALHLSIAVLMGLWSFALNMIAADLVFLLPFGSVLLSMPRAPDKPSSESYSVSDSTASSIE